MTPAPQGRLADYRRTMAATVPNAPTVRDAVIADADVLGRIHVHAWQAAYRGGLVPDDHLDALSVEERAGIWRQALATEPRPRCARLVAETDAGTVVGFALVGPAIRDEDDGGDHADHAQGELYAINVDPDAWGTGAGSALIAAGLERLGTTGFTDVILWVHPGNDRARRFYERRGWAVDGIERRADVFGVDVAETRYSIHLDR